MLLLHSQRRYIFEYDQSDYLLSVTMPSMVRHALQTMLSVGYYRNIYTPPDSTAAFIQDITRDGRLLQTLYPGTGRRVLYKYTKQSRLSEILYDTTQVTFTYEESSGVIKTIHLMHDGFICTIRYRQTGLCNYNYFAKVFGSDPALTWHEIPLFLYLLIFYVSIEKNVYICLCLCPQAYIAVPFEIQFSFYCLVWNSAYNV